MNWRRAARILSVPVVALLAGAALAQQPIPEGARKVRITVPGDGYVVIDDKRLPITASAQFRDPDNRIVLPAALRGTYLARVIVDSYGGLWRAWLLRPVEEAPQRVLP